MKDAEQKDKKLVEESLFAWQPDSGSDHTILSPGQDTLLCSPTRGSGLIPSRI